MSHKIIRIIKDHKYRFITLDRHGLLRLMPDKRYLKKFYKIKFDKKIDFRNPIGFNQKLQWLKLYDRKPVYSSMVDKYEVKNYVSERIGEEYVIPTLGVWAHFDDIDFDKLPEQFVLKCTHDSGGLIIVRDKSVLDKNKARAKIEKSLKRNYFYHGREWPYKNVKPRIIAEQYMEHKGAKELPVYKIMTFGGVPKIIQTIQGDKTPDEAIDYFDTDWNLLDLRQNYPNSKDPLPRPKKLEKMLELAAEFAKGFAFLRVDFYEINGDIYFSEFTFYSDSGMAKFDPEEWDYTLGSWITLPEKNR